MRVKVNSSNGTLVYSTYHPLTYGTPQGSCLGLLLLLIFVNDLHYSVKFFIGGLTIRKNYSIRTFWALSKNNSDLLLATPPAFDNL